MMMPNQNSNLMRLFIATFAVTTFDLTVCPHSRPVRRLWRFSCFPWSFFKWSTAFALKWATVSSSLSIQRYITRTLGAELMCWYHSKVLFKLTAVNELASCVHSQSVLVQSELCRNRRVGLSRGKYRWNRGAFDGRCMTLDCSHFEDRFTVLV